MKYGLYIYLYLFLSHLVTKTILDQLSVSGSLTSQTANR